MRLYSRTLQPTGGVVVVLLHSDRIAHLATGVFSNTKRESRDEEIQSTDSVERGC
jgi:hypothetical protein